MGPGIIPFWKGSIITAYYNVIQIILSYCYTSISFVFPTYGRRGGTRWSIRSLPTQTMLWFYDFQNIISLRISFHLQQSVCLTWFLKPYIPLYLDLLKRVASDTVNVIIHTLSNFLNWWVTKCKSYLLCIFPFLFVFFI